MEMMVTVAILALMIASFGQILAEAQDLVVTSQAIMKANARATALAGIIRDDVSRASKLGFLHIDNSKHRMYIGVPGACKSITGYTTGTGGIVAVGRKNASPAENGLLYRGKWILSGDSAVDTGNDDDVFTTSSDDYVDFTEIQTADDTEMNAFISRMNTLTNGLAVDPNTVTTLTDVSELWPLLARHCKALTIEALNDSMALTGGSGTGTWTKASADWPAALKITMTLSDPEIADRADIDGDFTYEIICPVRP
jgi:hypothetical protein